QIDFVFTVNPSSTNSNDWDNNSGNDWHVPVSEMGLYTPLEPGPNDTIRIKIAHTVGGNLWWGVNGWDEPVTAYQPPGSSGGDPGQSIESPLTGPDTAGYYTIQLGPFNLGGQPVSEMNFVLHWSDGTWDNNNGQDYRIPFNFEATPTDPSISLTNITTGQTLADPQPIQVSTSNSVYNEVRIDGQLRMVSSAAEFNFDLNTADLSYGEHTLYGFARAANGRVMFDMKTVWKTPEITYAALPPMDYVGVHDRLDGTVTFALLAPGKRFVSLVGDFNDWDPMAGVMTYDSVRSIWWTNLALDPGTYEYMYDLDGALRVGDPFAVDLNWVDANGNEHWARENQKSVLELGGESFEWTDDGFQKPAMEDLVIYELLARDFSSTQDFQGVIDKLDYLQDLGINAIELMPNYEFPGESSWGYNPAFFMAVESSYGTQNKFKELVNEAHNRGIAVLMDLVFNHADGSSPYHQMYGTNYADSPYMHAETNDWGFPDFDHGKEGTKLLTSRTVQHWINEFHIDGYRYDHTTGIGWSGVNDYGVSYFSWAAYQADGEVYQIAEHFGADVASLINGTKIRSHWHDAFHDQMKANLRQGSFEGSWYGDMNKTERGISFAADGFSNLEACVNYLESHDEQRVIWEAQTNGLSYSQAVQKAKLGAEVLFTAAGIPMFYMGAEFGMDTERTIDYNPLQWNYLDDPVNHDIFQHYKRLIWLRNSYPALRSNSINVVAKNNAGKTIVYHRTLDGHPGVVVAVNFSTSPQTLDIQFPHNGTWYEFVQDDTVSIESEWYGGYTIPASSARIFTSEHLWVDVVEESPQPKSFTLGAAYPNPFNPVTNFRYHLPATSTITLVVRDINGREVSTLTDGLKQPGSYAVRWNGTDDRGRPVASGVYFYTLTAKTSDGEQTFHASRKILLMK
ncbi:MAG: T9SS type A sorting domain-containing protein, partial [Candidatus Marinimicrobia bacterium]|nr:T9SS type A sorting domain-containing protein [Candidatus Neomarinimicrobiota bacterium]